MIKTGSQPCTLKRVGADPITGDIRNFEIKLRRAAGGISSVVSVSSSGYTAVHSNQLRQVGGLFEWRRWLVGS